MVRDDHVDHVEVMEAASTISSDWPLVGRDPVIDELVDVLVRRSSAILRGLAGLGESSVSEEPDDRHDTRRHDTRRHDTRRHDTRHRPRRYSSVSGGRTRSVSGTYDWQGGQYESDL